MGGEIREGGHVKRAWAALALIGVFGCAPRVPPAMYTSQACRNLALIDAASAQPILGVEDAVYDASSRTLFVSAYDRLAVERAAASAQATEPPAGGVYAISADQLGRSSLNVHDLLGAVLPARARPHGLDALALPDGRVRLAIINRALLQSANSRDWHLRPELEVVDVSREGVRLVSRILSPSLCSANDVAFADAETVQVTLDRGECLEDGHAPVGGPALARVTIDGATNTRPAPALFPNGAAYIGKALWIAATRQNLLVQGDNARRIKLPGAPDNLTLDNRNRLVIAVHPQLWRFGFHRYGWPGFNTAPTRIVRFDPERRSLAILFDDPEGRRFSGASVAVLAEGKLVLGGIRERGLLVCAAQEGSA